MRISFEAEGNDDLDHIFTWIAKDNVVAAYETARLMDKWLSERLGQQFVIENRSGATRNIATDVAVRAPSDGYRARRRHHLNGEFHDTKIDHRDRFSRGPIFFAGVHTGAKPGCCIDP